MESRQIYGIKGSDNQADFVCVTSNEGGTVEFHPMAGGFNVRVPAGEFAEKFAPVGEERMRNILKTFARVEVDTDSMARPIPAWSNGTLWNGWQVPYFERGEIERAIADGTLDSYHTKVVMLADAALVLLSISGDLPENHDWNAIADRLRAGEEVYEEEVGGSTLEASLCPAIEIEAEGHKVQTFAVGDGWCWQLAAAPETSPAP